MDVFSMRRKRCQKSLPALHALRAVTSLVLPGALVVKLT